MGLFDDIGHFLGDYFTGGAYTQRDIANQNLGFQEQNLDWQKEMQAESWKRDDTAVQRRAADLSAAGINPLLAAGSSAGNAPVVHTEAPQLDPNAAGKASAGNVASAAAEKALGVLSMTKDFAVKDAQAQLLQSQKQLADTQSGKTSTENYVLSSMLPGNLKLQSADIELKADQARSLAFDVDKLKPAEVAEKMQNIEKSIQDVKQSNWTMVNGSLITQIEQARVRNENLLRAQGISESNAKLAAAAVELQLLKNRLEVSSSTMGAQKASQYVDVVKNMDMVKMLGMHLGNPGLFQKISDLLK